MHINFYTYTGRTDAVNKSLSSPTQLTGNELTGMQELTDPVINIKSASAPVFNYAYIQEFGKYYFLDPPVWVGNDVYQYQFHEDVLYTFRTHILAQSGIVRYSAQGREDMYDPRIAFESVPAVGSSTLGVTDNSRYVLRYWNISEGPMHVYNKTICVAFMNDTSYNRFLQVYSNMSESDRVIVGTCIQDVTHVHYLKLGDSNSGIYSLPDTQQLIFQSAESNTSVTVDLYDSGAAIQTAFAYIIDSISDVSKLSYVDIQTPATWTDGKFWTGSSNWRILLPYAGGVELRPSDTGFYNITYTALRIAYEPFENAYVITPYINDRAFIEAQQVIPVQTTCAFPIDTSFDNISGNRIATILSGTAGVVKGAAEMATGNPMGAVSIASSVMGSANSLASLNVQAGIAGASFAGVTGGVPAYTDTLDGSKIYWIHTTAVPRSGYASLWTDYGKPDGAYRALSTLSGYAEVSDVHIPLASGLTDPERQQILSLLSGGVVF